MNRTMKLGVAIILTMLFAVASVFADQRPRRDTYGTRTTSVDGRIRDIDRDRNGIVIELDRGVVVYASRNTEVYNRSQRGRSGLRQLERGDRIRATGRVSSRGTMYADTITVVREEDDRRDRNDRTLHGVVESVDASRRMVWLRDNRSNRVIEVDLRNAERNDWSWGNEDRDDRRSRWNDLSRVRRGDRMSVRGDWRSDGRFEGERYNVTQ